MNSVHSLLVTSFLLSKMLDQSMNQPVGLTCESQSIPAQAWHPKSHTAKKEILPGFSDSNGRGSSSLPNCWGKEADRFL